MKKKRFNRFELKYRIKAAVADRLAKALLENMVPDPEGDVSGSYAITSLYFDTPGLDFYRAKIEGLKFRRKLRIRRYGQLSASPDAAVTVEIKQRINRTTQKRRVAMSLADAFTLCRGEDAGPFEDPVDAATASEIEYLVRSLSLHPVCTVGYQRAAYMGSSYDPGLRVTFDRALWVRDPKFALTDDGARHTFLPPSEVILEVKANDAVPLWISRMLALHGCEIDRYSKYCEGVRCLRSLLDSDRIPAEEDRNG